MRVQEAFVSVQASPAVVERYLTDQKLLAKWLLTRLVPIEGDFMARGGKHQLRLNLLGVVPVVYTVTERDSNHILMNIDGLWKGTELWRWFAEGSYTIVQNRIEYEIPNDTVRVFADGVDFLFFDIDMRVQMNRLRQAIDAERRRQLTGKEPKQLMIDVE